LDSYELERKPVAHAVIESSGALVRATKYRNQSTNNNHAEEYVHLVKKYADYITGMGIRYASPHNQSINIGFRLMDFQFRFDSLDEWKWFYKSQFARWNGKFHLISFSDSSNANNIDNEELAEVNWLVFQPSMVKEYKQLELLLSIRQHGNHLLVRPDMYVSGQGFHIGSLMVKNNSK
jgi:hypothetical protein